MRLPRRTVLLEFQLLAGREFHADRVHAFAEQIVRQMCPERKLVLETAAADGWLCCVVGGARADALVSKEHRSRARLQAD
jgi:hypothetical protein